MGRILSSQTLNEIMPMIYRRFTEKSAEEWRQIYKSLQLLEFLIKHGSERVIDDARGHVALLKMLRQFHYIDQNGKDQGLNVRNRAKELADLLADVDRIRAERKKARATKNKYTGVEGGISYGGGLSSGSSRYGGFGNESSASAAYGGYSGGVYGDGGGFGGQADDFRDSAGRSDRFEEYDEFDDDERPATSSRSTRRTDRTSSRKKAPEASRKQEPEVDLFSFDEPTQTSSAPAPNPAAKAELGKVTETGTGANDEDEFDDFQSAAPTAAATTTTAPSISALAQPLSPPQATSTKSVLNMPSITPAPTSSATSGRQTSASGPNYFGLAPTQNQPPMATSTANTGLAAGGLGAAKATAAPAASSGADAFGALWGKASAGIKKTDSPGSGPTMGQLAKEKSSAGIWGAPAAPGATPSSQPTTAVAQASASGSALDDLLG